MRVAPMIVIASVLAAQPAYADQSVAGYWMADLGDSVTIEMNVEADGQWNSQTMQSNQLIAEMAGFYRQTVKSPTRGLLVFTPTKSHMTSGHGPKVEHDVYQLSADGQVLRLTASGDTMEFHKLTP